MTSTKRTKWLRYSTRYQKPSYGQPHARHRSLSCMGSATKWLLSSTSLSTPRTTSRLNCLQVWNSIFTTDAIQATNRLNIEGKSWLPRTTGSGTIDLLWSSSKPLPWITSRQVLLSTPVQWGGGGYFAGLKQTQSSITFKHTIATIVTDVFSLNLNSLQPNFAASSADTSILQFSGLWRSHCGVAHKTDTRTQLQFMVNYHPSIEKFRWLSSNCVQSHHSCEANKYQISKPIFFFFNRRLLVDFIK